MKTSRLVGRNWSKAAGIASRVRGGRVAFAATIITLSVMTTAGAAPDAPSGWSQWRGPLGTGASPDADPPIHWSETENVRFKVEIPGNSLSSPVIWGDKIFLMSAVSVDERAFEEARAKAQATMDAEEWPPDVAPVKQRFLIQARSVEDGSLLWEQTAREAVPHESHYLDSSWASASPIVDGERVYVHFGSNGTYAYDLEGELLWQTDLGEMTTRRGFGEGSSPALYGDALVINWDHEGDSFVVALDKRTGEELWRSERPDEVTSWSTPLVVEYEGKPQVVISSTGYSRGYDLATGSELWRLAGMTVNSIPSPLHRDDTVYLASGYRGNMMQAVDLSQARGDLEDTDAVLWQYEKDTPYVASVLLLGEQLYFVKHLRNIFSSIDAETGQHHFTARLPGISNVYASPIGAAGRIYVFDRGGAAVVLKHGPELEVLAQNELDDGIDATPALVGSDLYIRGRHYLYRISNDD